MFFPLFIAILLGLASPSQTTTNSNTNGTTVNTTNGTSDDGGENGHVPPGETLPVPPPPPTGL